MPRTSKPPSYRLHRPTGQAVVTLDGKDYYLGLHDTKVSRDAYDRFIGEWLANGHRLPATRTSAGMSVSELILAYWKHAETYYVKNGRPTSEVTCVREAMRPLKRLYGSELAEDFGPLALKACRGEMVASDLSRRTVNNHVARIKRAFKWAASAELIPTSVYHGLQAVSGLSRGRSEARETEPVKPVPDEHVDAIRPHVSGQVWAIVELQRLTGMRSGEVVIMRGRDLDMTGGVWLYRPASHKTQHHGHDRIVDLGPRAQHVVKPFLKADLEAYLFSPADAVAERKAERRRNRKTPVQPSQRDRAKAKAKRAPGLRYTPGSYRYAIARACEIAEVPHWHPHQVRHNYGTMIRKEFGVETARIMLGQKSIAVAEIYAEVDRAKVRDVALKIG